MTIREALKVHEDASILLSFVLKKDKAFLFTHPEKKLRIRKLRSLRILIKKRQAGWPAAYLTGYKEFYGLDFLVTPDVLIPRPETETLVELVIGFVRSSKSAVKILDIGTGSGCIIISLAKALSSFPSPSRGGIKGGVDKAHRFFASDISAKALAVAKKNAKRHGIKVQFKHGDLLAPWKNQRFDIIVANLPYLAKETDPSTKFEPQKALLAKKQGLALIENLLQQLFTLHASRFTLFLEFDPRQTTQIKKLAAKYLPGYCAKGGSASGGKIKLFKDLAGKWRFAALTSA